MQIRIDHHTCIGSGQCVLTAPGVFTQDEDGYSELVPEGAAATTRRQVQEAALSCPVQAITLENGSPGD
ncbi:ferredoxin [Streptomyces sp. SID3343]|uniref:ferredoxin n=1 Tax=Streptomyces sp. SID3343 TaxID=2690260 RepID=UPI00136C9F39|nr:ferredoxin [Streptomyces sp. SID3343]MYW02374.1 ferredoxin [Streptomyces sp. SID3343]